jgi:hypothetical protein
VSSHLGISNNLIFRNLHRTFFQPGPGLTYYYEMKIGDLDDEDGMEPRNEDGESSGLLNSNE